MKPTKSLWKGIKKRKLTLLISFFMVTIFLAARAEGNVFVSVFGWMPLFPLLMLAIGMEEST